MIYEARWQAASTSSSLPASQPAGPVLLAALPGSKFRRPRSKLVSSASSDIKSTAAPQLPAGQGLAIRALATGGSTASRLLSAGLHLAQQACGAAAASMGVLQRGCGPEQPAGSRPNHGAAGMAAMLKVAAAEHPGSSFTAASLSPAAPQLHLDVLEVRNTASVVNDPDSI